MQVILNLMTPSLVAQNPQLLSAEDLLTLVNKNNERAQKAPSFGEVLTYTKADNFSCMVVHLLINMSILNLWIHLDFHI